MSLSGEMSKWISKMEGWAPDTRAWRNNNPGNLNWVPGMVGSLPDPTKDAEGYAVFESPWQGWDALDGLISRVLAKHPNLTLKTFCCGERDETGKVIEGGYAGYAPNADPRGANNCGMYAAFLAHGLGIASVDTPLSDYGKDAGSTT